MRRGRLNVEALVVGLAIIVAASVMVWHYRAWRECDARGGRFLRDWLGWPVCIVEARQP